jgi:hypothetical protein
MKSLQIAVFVSIVALSAIPAGAQFGLYGSPEILNLSRTDPAAVPYDGYATPASYPTQPAVVTTRTVPAVPFVAVPLPQYTVPSVRSAVAGRYTHMLAEPAPPESAGLPPGLSQSAVPTQTPHGLDPMLSEAGPEVADYYGQAAAGDCARCDVPEGSGGCLTRAVCGFEGAALAGWGGGFGSAEGWGPWYASASALVMGRNAPNRLWTTYESGNEPNQIDGTNRFEWRWGGEVRFGRRFCCCGSSTWAVEATYWTLEPLNSLASITHPNGVSTTLTVGNVFFGGYPATEWFDNALEHRLRRRNEIHNVELNLVRYRIFSAAELPWDLSCSAGVRFFRFDENLVFSSVADPVNMTDPTMHHEAFLDDRITNNLIGFQLGFDADFYMTPSLRMFVTPKFGIYNNRIEHLFRAYLGDGTVATQYEYPGLTYPVSSTTDVVSFLTQIDVGLAWHFAANWSAQIGYRAVVATQVGLADHQIPHFIVDIPEIANIDANGDLILHGGFVGLAYNF